MILNKQLTITWHVGDLKFSYDEKDVLDALFQCTKDTYEDVKKLKPSRFNIRDYISMALDYTTSGEVKNYMK